MWLPLLELVLPARAGSGDCRLCYALSGCQRLLRGWKTVSADGSPAARPGSPERTDLLLTVSASRLAFIVQVKTDLVRNYMKGMGEQIQLRDFAGISKMPNNKTDLNASIVSTNLLGAGLAYIEADLDTRKRILEEHRSWAHGLLYLLANDLRLEVGQFGLAMDEFEDTNHWARQALSSN